MVLSAGSFHSGGVIIHRAAASRSRLSPEAATPDRIIEVAAFELDPDVGADRRYRIVPDIWRIGHARHAPVRHHARDRRNLSLNAAETKRIEVLEHPAAKFAVILFHLLSVVDGGCTLRAVEIVMLKAVRRNCRQAGQKIRLLSGLIGASLSTKILCSPIG